MKDRGTVRRYHTSGEQTYVKGTKPCSTQFLTILGHDGVTGEILAECKRCGVCISV